MKIIETLGLTRKFGDFTANDSISFAVEQGEIKAIVGENGAGKTTLVNMLYGLSKPTKGEIRIGGQPVKFNSPTDAIEKGLGMVHQHFKLAPGLTVYENVLLGIELRHKNLPFIDRTKQEQAVQKVIQKYHFKLDASAKVEDLSVGERQRVEILKMLYREVEVLILDEPTAVLTPQEVEQLIENLKDLKRQGKTIILITHKLGEVMALADTVTVIRRGKVVGEVDRREASEIQLAQMMVGRDVLLQIEKEEEDKTGNPVVYRLEDIATQNMMGKEVISNISLSIRKGEILGIAGVEGNGQSELIKVITGMMLSTRGKITFKDKDLTNSWPRQIRDRSIGIIAEDRYAEGLCDSMSIADNLIAGYHYRSDVCRHGIMQKKIIDQKRDRLIGECDIRMADKEGYVSQLSGGNAQKLIIAREFDQNPELLLACQPTRGVDIGSIEFIHKQILKLAAKGTAVLLISSELTEVMSLSDRIAVMYQGRIIATVHKKETGTTELGLLMAGVVPDLLKRKREVTT